MRHSVYCCYVSVTNVSAYVALLLLNVFGALTYFIASMNHSVSNQSGLTFGVSILLLVLFVPCSFVCWFRPVYNAFQWACSSSCSQLYLWLHLVLCCIVYCCSLLL